MHDANSSRLANRVAVITGGAQGIGRAIAVLFQKEGAQVIILDCDSCAGNETATALSEQDCSRPVRFLKVDLAEPVQIETVAKEIKDLHYRVDVLVNNAGVEIEKPLEDVTVADWDVTLAVNLRGAFLLTKAMVPLFPSSGGSIVNISSIHATHAFPASIPYACSKAGMIALTRNLGLELASRHIRVNCICPGYIDTRLWEHYLHHSADPAAVAEQTTALHPLGRRGVPHDIGEAALFFASDSSGFVTGTELVVDGGLTIRAHP